ncbi:MAG: hypothetical protein SO064_05680 [Prevotella sp.]|nr:hypothetical protein [Prevotella sp.]
MSSAHDIVSLCGKTHGFQTVVTLSSHDRGILFRMGHHFQDKNIKAWILSTR